MTKVKLLLLTFRSGLERYWEFEEVIVRSEQLAGAEDVFSAMPGLVLRGVLIVLDEGKWITQEACLCISRIY